MIRRINEPSNNQMKLTKRPRGATVGIDRWRRVRIRAPGVSQLIRVFAGPEESGPMTAQTGAHTATFSSLALAALPYLTLLGCAAVVVEVAVGFEEPHFTTLLISSVLIAAAPLGMAIHLALTSELTAGEKRTWVTALMTRRAPRLFAAYFNPAARRVATEEIRTHPNRPATEAP